MDLNFAIVLDVMSCLFIVVVLYISACVTLFSGFYICHEEFLSRFLWLVFLFVSSIVVVILFPRFFSLMVG